MGLHIVAIGFYAVVRRKALVPAMLHGNQPVPSSNADQPLPASRDGIGQ